MTIAQRPSLSPTEQEKPQERVDRGRAAKALLRSIVELQRGRKIIGRLLLSVILSFIASVLMATSPILFSKAVDAFSLDRNMSMGALTLVTLSVVALGVSKFMTEQRWLVYQPAENQILNSVRETYLRHLLNLPVAYHLNRSMGRLDSIVGQGIGGIQTLSGMLFTQLSPLVFEIAITTVAVFTFVDSDISLIIATTIVFYIATLVVGAEWISRRLKTALNATIDAQGVAGDAILNAEGIKTLVIEGEIIRSYRQRLDDAHVRFKSFYFSRGALGLTLTATLIVGFAAALFLSATRTMSGELSVGALVLTNAYVLQLIRTMEGFSFSYRDTRQSFEAVKRFLDVFAEEKDEDQHSLASIDWLSEIDVRGVSYRYADGRWALRDASLLISKGKITALLGKSGSGKSTLVRLLLKSLPVNEGKIFANGVDIEQVNGVELRRKIAVVPQDSVMFRESLGFNISLTTSPDHQKLQDAASAAEISELIASLPDGFDTEIGERGLKLSGGERQRVAIARAIYRDANILVFDEATSALDEATKNEILNLIRSLSSERGILLITHDQTAAAIADTIVTLGQPVSGP